MMQCQQNFIIKCGLTIFRSVAPSLETKKYQSKKLARMLLLAAYRLHPTNELCINRPYTECIIPVSVNR